MKTKDKAKETETTLLKWITRDLGKKEDFVQYAGDLYNILDAYPTTKEIVKILAEHSPNQVEGIYANVYDRKGRFLREVLLTTKLDWKDDIEEQGLMTKREIIQTHERQLKWLKIKTPMGVNEIRVPNKTERIEIFTKQKSISSE